MKRKSISLRSALLLGCLFITLSASAKWVKFPTSCGKEFMLNTEHYLNEEGECTEEMSVEMAEDALSLEFALCHG